MSKLILRRWLPNMLAWLSLIWIVLLVFREQPMEMNVYAPRSWLWLWASILTWTFATFHSAWVFQALLESQIASTIRFSYAARLLFVGQIIRHLPGRFWGLVYQLGEAGEKLPARILLRTNVDFMLLSLFFAIIIPLVVLLYFHFGLGEALILGGGTLWIMIWLMKRDYLGMGLAILGRWLPESLSSYIIADVGSFPVWKIIRICSYFLSQWFFYLLAWYLLGKALPGLENAPMLLLCAFYFIAWAIGFLSLITPSGIGVREAVFVFMSFSLIDPATLSYLAIFARIWMLLTDIILFAVFFFIRPSFNTGPPSPVQF